MTKQTRTFAQTTLITHLLVGAIGATAVIQVRSISPAFIYLISFILAATASCIASRYLQLCLQNGLEILENAVVRNEKPVGDSEFHRAADHIVTHVSRLAAVAARGREQSGEVESVLAAFDRRTAGDRKSSPSRQLSLLLKSLGRDALQTIDGVKFVTSEIQALRAQSIATDHDEIELVRNAAAHIAQLAEDVNAISNHTKQAKSNDSTAAGDAEGVFRQSLSLQNQLETLREQVQTCDKRGRTLRDQTVEIASLMETIHEYSSKTDTMALNASIESVRAGEHGRAFAAAADEIRKLTSIISDSTKDALDRLHLVEASVDDTTSIYAQGHATIDQQMATTRDLSKSLSNVRQSTHQSREHLDHILSTADSQMQTLNIVATALSGVFESSERNHARAEEERLKGSQLDEELTDLARLLSPLRGTQKRTMPTQQEQPRAGGKPCLTATSQAR